MDLYSHRILAPEISNTLDERMHVEAARKVPARYGKPKFIHTDKGNQLTSKMFTKMFKDVKVKISIGERV